LFFNNQARPKTAAVTTLRMRIVSQNKLTKLAENTNFLLII